MISQVREVLIMNFHLQSAFQRIFFCYFASYAANVEWTGSNMSSFGMLMISFFYVQFHGLLAAPNLLEIHLHPLG